MKEEKDRVGGATDAVMRIVSLPASGHVKHQVLNSQAWSQAAHRYL